METLGRFGVQPGSQEWTLLSENRGGLKLYESHLKNEGLR